MNDELQKSLTEIAQAIEHLNRAFEKRAEDLRNLGDSAALQQWIKATHAMRDSGNIYLTWAKHYARSAGIKSIGDESDENDLLDEGNS